MKHQYTIAAGRQILRDGVSFVGIQCNQTTNPGSADEFTREVVALLGRPTLCEAVVLVRRADGFFRRSALAWERGQTDRGEAYSQKCKRQELDFAAKGEALLAPLGITCEWSGLYPSFKFAGVTYHDTLSAVSAAMEGGKL